MSQPLRFSPFLGMLPRTAERMLPEAMSVEADNLDFSSGEIRALKGSLLVYTPPTAGPWLSVARPEWNGTQKWLSWTKDVDFVQAPLTADLEPRYYWTGDSEPRFAKFSDLPNTFYALGIPKPVTAPGVSPSGGTGAQVTRAYCYTFFSALGEESAPSPVSVVTTGRVDDTWAITGMDAFPANTGAVTGSYAGGVTTFSSASNHWLRVGDEVLLGTAKVQVASVPSSTSFTVSGNYAAITSWSRVAPWNTTGMKRRLYRSAGTVASFQLVNDNVGTTYNDTLTDAQIMGDELISQTWGPPPAGLRGIFVHPSGALGGFVGSRLRLSEPYQGHAWPSEYDYGCESEIIGAATFGNTIVACTATRPHLFTGNDPSTISNDKANEIWPCLSKRGVVSTGDGVAFPTRHGMAYVGLSGNMLSTEGYFTQTEWEPLDPTSMIAAVAEGRVFVRFLSPGGSKGVMVFTPTEPQAGMRRLAACPDELYADPRSGKLYLVDSTGVSQYNASTGAKLNYSWRSREVYLPTPGNYGACKIDFQSEISQADYDAANAAYQSQISGNQALVSGYAGLGGVNRSQVNGMLVNGSNIKNIGLPALSSVTFSLFCDGDLVHARQVIGGDGFFKLPAGKKYSTVQIALNGTVRVKAVRMAQTADELRSIP